MTQVPSLPALHRACFVFALVLTGAAAADENGRESGDVHAGLRSDVAYLSSEPLRGRSVDDAEAIGLAADYIAQRMKSIGLKTDLFDGGPFQRVPVRLDAVAGPADRNRIVFTSDASNQPWTASLDRDMTPLAIGSLSGRVVGPLVLAGYGITAPEHNYDDYQGIDVSGAVVVILRKEPGAANPDSPFAGVRNTRHAFFSTKIENAIRHGASAVIIVNDPNSIERRERDIVAKIDRERASRMATEKQLADLPAEAVKIRERLTIKLTSTDDVIAALQREIKQVRRGLLAISEAGQRAEGKDAIPVVSVSRPLVDQVLRRASGRSLTEIEQRIDQTFQPQSIRVASVRADLQIELTPAVATTSNVIGVIPGRGPLANESVVVGAHYDHVGMGGYGSLAPGTIAIHNGADDNASGTAVLLATAQRLVDRLASSQPHRRVIIIAFTGEERGLVGSKYYVRHPRFALESTVAMVNMDMVGRLRDNELTVYGTGSAPAINEILDRSNRHQQFDLFRVATGYGPSDHQSFYEAGIPVIFFFTGLHDDYHRPSDDFDKINFGGATRITDIVSDVMHRLATRPERLQYVRTTGKVRIRRQMTAYLGLQLSGRRGVTLTGVTPGGPAERDGLRVGDRIVKLGGKSVTAPAEVLEQLREYRPKDKLVVSVIRDGRNIEIPVVLGTRPESP